MSELRWVLLLLGALVIGLTWALGTGRLNALLERLRPSRKSRGTRLEPSIDQTGFDDFPAKESIEPIEPDQASPDESKPDAGAIDRVITVRFVPKEKSLRGDKVVLALRAAGLRHGQYGIFHMYADDLSQVPVFSVANLTEPGSFDLANLTETRIPGMNFFLVLPGEGDPVDRFDRMVDSARELSRTLDAELRDERGSSWSIQRERYVREEVIEYRHQSEGAPAPR